MKQQKQHLKCCSAAHNRRKTKCEGLWGRHNATPIQFSSQIIALFTSANSGFAWHSTCHSTSSLCAIADTANFSYDLWLIAAAKTVLSLCLVLQDIARQCHRRPQTTASLPQHPTNWSSPWSNSHFALLLLLQLSNFVSMFSEHCCHVFAEKSFYWLTGSMRCAETKTISQWSKGNVWMQRTVQPCSVTKQRKLCA